MFATWFLLSFLQTTKNVLQLFSVHSTKQPAVQLQASSTLNGLQLLCKVNINVKASQPLSEAPRATCLLATSAAVIVGLEDGALASYSWNAQVRAQ